MTVIVTNPCPSLTNKGGTCPDIIAYRVFISSYYHYQPDGHYRKEHAMIKTEFISSRSVVRVHDEFIRKDVDAVMPQLNNIVSESYRRRLTKHLRYPQSTIH